MRICDCRSCNRLDVRLPEALVDSIGDKPILLSKLIIAHALSSVEVNAHCPAGGLASALRNPKYSRRDEAHCELEQSTKPDLLQKMPNLPKSVQDLMKKVHS